MPRGNTEQEIKKALSNARTFIVKRKDADNAVQRWPFVADDRQKVLDYLKEQDPGGTHEIENVFSAPTLIV